MNITSRQISAMIADYIAKGYGKKVKERTWKGQYIHGHAPWNNAEDCYHKWLRIINDYIVELSNLTTFTELYNTLETLKIDGIGDLTIYDTATMIGCPNGVYPEVVYLHAGTANGAKALGINGVTATKEQFVDICDAFEKLEPIQIEDFLCIYKKQLAGKTDAVPQSCCSC